MEAKRFIGEVLDDGHLSLPGDTALQVGQQFEVILLPLEEAETGEYAEALARRKGFADLTEEDVARIIHESRGVR
ncbi:MAG TPA: hypothetical protein VNE39_14765 [Planctomycetota bacterium]|nr:hypothetical protein [Planctomycetota bacterium]